MFPELINEARVAQWSFAPYRPRVSQNGRCLRAAVYDAFGYQEDKETPDGEAIGKMNDGNLHEEGIKSDFEMIGCHPFDCQRDIYVPAKTHTGFIRGKIDFLINIDETGLAHVRNRGIPVPEFVTPGTILVEAKSIKEYAFDKIASDKPMDAHANQAIMYLHKLIEEGVYIALIIYKCKNTSRYKEFWLTYNPVIALSTIEQFEKVEEYRKQRILPPRISTDPQTYPCSTCEFKRLCFANLNVEIQTGLMEQALPDEIVDKVNRYDKIRKEASGKTKEKDDLNEELKLWMITNKISSAQTDLYNVSVTWEERQGYPVAPKQFSQLNVRPIKKKKAPKSQ